MMSFIAASRPRRIEPAPRAELPKGQRIGRFRIVRLLGRGGMASVYLAEDVTLRRYVALKLLAHRSGTTAVRVEQFIREARAAAALEHPNVVQIYEVGLEGDWYFIAMEHVEGGTLHDLVKLGRPIGVRQACLLAAEAADALAMAHEHGILHRDIKPANLMLTRPGRCKVTDFGLARTDDPADTLRLPHEAVGSPHFVAPELLRGEPATRASDIYSLACTLWYLLTGMPPYRAATRRELLLMHVRAPIPRLGEIRTDVSDDLSDVLMKAMAKQPAERHASMASLAKLLRSHTIAADEPHPPATVQPGQGDPDVINDLVGVWPSQPLTPPRRRANPTGWIVGAGLALLVGVLLIRASRTEPPTPPSLAQPAAVVVVASTAAPAPEEPPPTPVPAAAEPAPTPAAAPAPVPAAVPVNAERVYTLADGAALAELAGQAAPCTFRGTITRCGTSHSGSVFQIFFNPPGQQDVIFCVYFPALYPSMQQLHGGTHGSGLAGKTVEVRGKLKVYRGIPQIVINDPEQLRVLP